ncbi:MAG: hypothetical protein KA974_09545 [Saprospiraceae bacterium]|nr:hypothetical protein [Saprospiraceae bacterium]
MSSGSILVPGSLGSPALSGITGAGVGSVGVVGAVTGSVGVIPIAFEKTSSMFTLPF